jgi:RNA binding exosome subunit
MPQRAKDSQIESKRLKTVHSVNISVFVHATEDEDKVLNALKLFLPDDAKVQKKHATGHYQNPIEILTVKIKRPRDIITFLDLIKRNLPKNDVNKLLNDLDSYVDDEGVLFIRVDKQEAVRNSIRLGKDDPILVRVKVAAYPARKEKALEVARGLLRDD